MNKPYVKNYKDGVLINPITKDKPYLHYTRSLKGNGKHRLKNNRKPLSDRDIVSRLVFVQRVMININNKIKKFTGRIILHKNNR